jgi:hypothetical protein
MTKQLPLIFAAAALASCGSTSSGGAGPTSSSSGGTIVGGTLDGTWDVVVTTASGNESRGTLTISPTLFSMSFGDFDLNAALNGGAPDVTRRVNGDTRKMSVSVAQGPFDTGALSFPLGGAWTIGEPQGRCTADVKAPTMSLDCGSISLPENVDRWVEGQSTAQRTATLPSSFGELGGTWNVIAPRGRVEAKFEGSVFTAKGFDDGDETGTVTMTFDGATASGSITDGTEVAAKRR